MKCLKQCLVFLSAWTCISVSVGIRVPSAWDEVQGRDGVRNFDGRIDPNHRFNNANGQQRYNNGGLERRVFVDNQQANAELGSLYSTLQSSALSNFFGGQHQMLVLNDNGLHAFPQNNQETAAIPSETNQYKTELPPLRHPRYPTSNPQLQNNNVQYQQRPVTIGGSQYQNNQNLGSIHIEPYDNNYQNVPSNVLRITPISSGNINLNNYEAVKQSQLRQPVSKRFSQKYKPSIHKEYARTPSSGYGSQLEVPAQSLKGHVAQDHTFIVSASTLSPLESDQNDPSLELSTKKEPIFFVTEGYTNVLVQGSNKKKYQKPQYQNQEASGKVLKTEKLERNDETERGDEEDEIPPRNRKVTKIYKNHGNDDDRGSNAGGSGRNLVESNLQKGQRLKRPQISTEDDRRSGLRNRLIENHRDDKLHEPSDYHDSEREDDDPERIENDENNDEKELETEEDTEDETEEETEDEDAEDSDEKDSPEPEIVNDTDTVESDESEETDEEDAESDEEEEPQQEVPHSEHADPKPVPTVPIYPGPGVWAKPGVKHKPYVSHHVFIKPQETEQKPDGYDVFEDLEKYFENQKDQYGRTFGAKIDQSGRVVSNTPIKPPNPVNPIVVYDPFNEPSEIKSTLQFPSETTNTNKQRLVSAKPENIAQPEDNDENYAENQDTEGTKEETFVPVQLYTQVRKSENEQHEPHNPLEHGRLREVIKDSKVQTVYSEEGYEDAAYDHAGHEKQAEQDQAHEQFEREKLEKLKPKEEELKDSYTEQSNKVLVTDDLVEDSLPADSIYPSLYIENIAENIETQHPLKKKTLSNNNFITTQELKTTQVKDKDNGDVQLEIQSEVKVIVQPNNSTKAHKYVKIYPKVLKEYSIDIPEENSLENNSDDNGKETSTENQALESDKPVATTQINKESSDIYSTSTETPFTVKVRAFDEFGNIATSEKPKVTVKVLDDVEALGRISDEYGKIDQVQRKRRSIDSENNDLQIDIGFIDKINHTFAEKQPEELNIEKYPYYTMPDLNENSPLRYAENMDNIPVKRGGELAFYKMADKYQCPDVPQNIDPIPEHVKNAKENEEENESDEDDEENEETDEESDEEENDDEVGVDQNHPKAPRIKLGDKIDCLKIRYFGDNPLDSPFFKEETVGPVKSIFKELDRKANKLKTNKNNDNLHKSTQIIENINKVNEIFNKKEKMDERIFASEVKDKVYNALKKPEHIDNTNVNINVNTLSSIENAESINTNIRVIKPIGSENLSRNPTPAPLVTLITTPKYTIQLTPKNIYDQITLLDHLPEEDVTEIIETSTKDIEPPKAKVMESRVFNEVTTEAAESAAPNNADQADRKKESIRRQPKILREENNNEDETQVTPEAEALRRRRLRPRKPLYQIFDVNKFLTTTPYSIINSVHSTVLPKYKVISEVFYKDEIKPNEQLNVFADVLNNIKNSTNLEPVHLQSASNFAEPDSVTISNLDEATIVQTSPKIRVKKYQKDSSHNQNIINRIPPQNIATTEKHYNARYPESYEEHLIPPHTSTHENLDIPAYQSPDKFGSIDKNTRNTPKNFYSGEDNNQYSSSHPNINGGTKKNLRRRKKPTKGTSTTSTSTTFRTTTNINVPDQSSPRNHKPYVIDVLEDTAQVVGLVPPSVVPSKGYRTIVEDSDGGDTNEVPHKVYEYKTIPPKFVTEQLTGPAAVTELIDEDTPSVRPTNKYYFLGLKPPLNQRARSYTEFMGAKKKVVGGTKNDNIRRRMFNNGYGHIGHMRFRRAAARASYSEVSRNRGSQNEGIHKDVTPYDEIDDYVPHRPKNFHYDENTGKIVYHDKHQVEKEVEVEDEEEEYEEIPETPGRYLETAEDATHPTPKKATTKPLLATATPPPEGKGLLDFVAKLKNNPTYIVIPDPTTPDPSSISSTQETVTVDPKSTSPPEFLSILSKVKSDSSYKIIEDPKESKIKVKSTTPKLEYEDDEEEETEEEEENIQNSPGGQTQDLANIQIFDIGEYLPKVKPVSPKTSIDYSKYKTIERPHTRHNISSRYNSDEQPNLEEVVTGRNPSTIEEKESIDKPVNSQDRIAHEKEDKVANEEVVTSSTQKMVQLRRGTRATTQRTTAEYVEPTESLVTRRTANRRRPVPSGFTRRTTTTEVTEATEKIQRVYPQNTQIDSQSAYTHPPAKRVYRKRPVRIRHTTERLEEDEDSVDKLVRRSLDYETDDVPSEFEEEFLGEVDVSQTYDNIKRDDIVNDDISETQDTILADNIAETETVPIKENSGLLNNSLQEKVASESNQQEIIEKSQNYGELINQVPKSETEKSKEKLDIEINTNNKDQDNHKEATQNLNIKEDIEIVDQDYDKERRHGGNFKRENAANVDAVEVVRENLNDQAKLLDETNNQSDVEIINKNFDKTQRHGGNYKTEEDAVTEELLEFDMKDVELQQTESKTNLRSENVGTNSDGKTPEEISTIEHVRENGQDDTSNNSFNQKNAIRVRSNSNPSPSHATGKIIERLTDIVPKPDHFYTDSQLPKQVNTLETEKSRSNLDSKELQQVTDEGDVIDVEEALRRQISNRRSYKTNVRKESNNGNDETSDSPNNENIESKNEDSVKSEDEFEEKVTPTKKPLFIKDASKRLYFYAPV